MAGVGSKLQAYLQKNDKSSTSSTSSLLETDGNRTWLPSFMKPPNPEDDNSTSSHDGTNGWFNEANRDPCLPSLSKKQRILGFMGCIAVGLFCFVLAWLFLPMVVVKPRKFALLYTLGSLFLIASFSLLWGPMNHVKHLLSGPRIAFTTAYLGTMFATIYFSVWYKSTALTIVFAVAQMISLVWYMVSYIPGGHTGMKFFTKIFYSAASTTVSKTLPV
ncbi:uncharacterized protein LOC141908825 [Tubulanus polymorphus]|uniref:uncharacterized protein LOC141908825 n=1 Tax=Tubulanus polymorphus TaxID=672921 RepID=UPI003DA45FFD